MDAAMILTGIALLAGFYAVLLIIANFVKLFKLRVSPVENENTYVVKKRAETKNMRTYDEDAGTYSNDSYTFGYMTFMRANGLPQEFTVSGELFPELNPDDAGILSTKGGWFYGFVRQV